MKIAFYAPLKSPNHPVPSGDRLMARLLVKALEMAGHTVEIASELRSFTATPDPVGRAALSERARLERERLLAAWRENAPQLWLTYHPYYKTPDEIGPAITDALGIAYMTAEASYSPKRDRQGWQDNQRLIADAVRHAAVNLCFTERDRLGLAAAVPDGRFARLPPFIDTALFQDMPAAVPQRLVTVAMMRPGDKLESYAMLAKALEMIRDRDWTLTIIGNGTAEGEVRALYAGLPADRIAFLGERSPQQVAAELRKGGTYVWPGCGEAYGLAYLEAQAAGLPVVAQATAGVPEVVMDGRTGILTPDGDVAAFATAVSGLIADPSRHAAMRDAARSFAHGERSLQMASRRLDGILRQYLGENHG